MSSAAMPGKADDVLLDVQDLRTTFPLSGGTLHAVNHVYLQLKRGEILGLVGESGSGKSMLGYSIMGLLEPPGRITHGRILFDGIDLTTLNAVQMRKIRGRRIAMIFQDPMMTLNPVLRIDTQMIEAIYAHEKIPHQAAWNRARDALAMVGIPSPEERMRAYPHQFSGGMRQRVAIATALLHKPELIIADEPTTALDVTIQAQILAEIQKLSREQNLALIWITHDLSVVARLADRIAVMYAGQIIETGDIRDVITTPRHPYTSGLIGSLPSRALKGRRLRQIPGSPPNLINLPPGCPFAPRCAHRQAACRENPEMPRMPDVHNGDAHRVRCFFPMHVSSHDAHREGLR